MEPVQARRWISCGLDDLVFESSQGQQKISCPCPNRAGWIWVSARYSVGTGALSRNLKLTTHPHLEPLIRMRGQLPQLPLSFLLVWAKATLHLIYLYSEIHAERTLRLIENSLRKL